MTFPILKPKISEKAAFLSEQRKYVFHISSQATSPEIKKAVKHLYGVDAIGVNIINRKGKQKRYRRTLHRRSGERMAIVTVAEGQKIDITASA
jgi:large subunit ribosomal protein L23